MVTQPLVSVVIPTFNRSDYCRQAVESALAQDYRPLEIIVVDDGGTDDTQIVVEHFGDPVRYVRQKNGGPAAARNTGVANSSGPFIAFLDSDDLWKPQKLSRQMLLLLDHPEVGMAFTAVEFFLEESGHISSVYFPGEEVTFHQSLGFGIVYVQSSIVRREVFNSVGGYDVALKGTEDWDFCMRVALAHRMCGINDPLTRIRLHEGHLSTNPRLMNENLWKALRKNSGHHGPDCVECRQAVKYTRDRLRLSHYKKLVRAAKTDWRGRRPGSAAAYAIKAICARPSSVPRLAFKSAARLIGRRSAAAEE